MSVLKLPRTPTSLQNWIAWIGAILTSNPSLFHYFLCFVGILWQKRQIPLLEYVVQLRAPDAIDDGGMVEFIGKNDILYKRYITFSGFFLHFVNLSNLHWKMKKAIWTRFFKNIICLRCAHLRTAELFEQPRIGIEAGRIEDCVLSSVKPVIQQFFLSKSSANTYSSPVLLCKN